MDCATIVVGVCVLEFVITKDVCALIPCILLVKVSMLETDCVSLVEIFELIVDKTGLLVELVRAVII